MAVFPKILTIWPFIAKVCTNACYSYSQGNQLEMKRGNKVTLRHIVVKVPSCALTDLFRKSMLCLLHTWWQNTPYSFQWRS